jgi:hypothetical protein
MGVAMTDLLRLEVTLSYNEMRCLKQMMEEYTALTALEDSVVDTMKAALDVLVPDGRLERRLKKKFGEEE